MQQLFFLRAFESFIMKPQNYTYYYAALHLAIWIEKLVVKLFRVAKSVG